MLAGMVNPLPDANMTLQYCSIYTV